MNANRVLLLEPTHFEKYPVSSKTIDFVLKLAGNIERIEVYVGEFAELKAEHHLSDIYFKEHPLNIGYAGIEEARDWIVPTLEGYYPSFFSYWKKVEKQVRLNY